MEFKCHLKSCRKRANVTVQFYLVRIWNTLIMSLKYTPNSWKVWAWFGHVLATQIYTVKLIRQELPSKYKLNCNLHFIWPTPRWPWKKIMAISRTGTNGQSTIDRWHNHAKLQSLPVSEITSTLRCAPIIPLEYKSKFKKKKSTAHAWSRSCT